MMFVINVCKIMINQDDIRSHGRLTSTVAIGCALYLEHDLLSVFMLIVMISLLMLCYVLLDICNKCKLEIFILLEDY
nr:TPA_asm: hypothetical protein [Becan tricladivirus 1]